MSRGGAARGGCPCGSGDSYSRCCAPLHRGAATAATAEQLMRSRYSAYAKGLEGYLIRTWAAGTRPDEVRLDHAIRWAGLEIREVCSGAAADRTGTVEFAAAYEVDGRAAVLHEVSWFCREGPDDTWCYVGEWHEGLDGGMDGAGHGQV
ncbi:MAG: YchJ family protein [Microthrixaceae bacterium]